jgi:precorrin-6A synthase
MRRALIIGIGAGDPDHLTLQAIKALNQVDVFLVARKGDHKDDLARLRREICDRFVTDRPYRMVAFDQPRREDVSTSYTATVHQWHAAIARRFEALLTDEVRDGECAGFLVWGDPSLYDSTLRILDTLKAGGFALDYDIIPGISSVQVLAARHKVPLNGIGESIEITTGRRLAERGLGDAGSTIVMLDGALAFRAIEPAGMYIHWGAYLGTQDEILISGALEEVADEIARVRAEARAAKGWIMDTYLLRKLKTP